MVVDLITWKSYYQVFKPDNIQSTQHVHKQFVSSKTAVQNFLKNCGNVSENWQDKLIKRICLLPASLLKKRITF